MQLIQVNSSTINNEVKQTVSARELHQFLEVATKFSDWIKRRIEEFGFVKEVDYVVLKNETQYNQTLTIEYALTLDMAKELSMVERNEKGKQARQYFIECERRAQNPLSVLSDPAAMRNLLLTYTEKVLTLEHTVDELKPRAAVADRITVAEGRLCIREAAKALKIPERKLVFWLLENKWLYLDQKGRLRGYADKTPRYIEHKVTPIPTDEDADKVSLQAMITPEGLTRLADIFNVEAELQEAA